MNQKIKILIGILIVGIVLIGGWWVWNQVFPEPETCIDSNEQCKGKPDGASCTTGVWCDQFGRVCGGQSCVGMGSGKCFKGRCVSFKEYENLARVAITTNVRIVKDDSKWVLLVDGRPFYIKGAGCGVYKGKNGEDYLLLAKELGANAVRTWGIDQGTREYLDTALKYGLKVSAGIWIDYATPENKVSFLNDSYKKKKEREVLNYIQQFKDHPAVLMWGVGNECVYFTYSEKEKVALCKFIDHLARKIHQIDPDHPVMYASSNFVELKYIKKYMPSIDIVGMNVYPSLRTCHSVWKSLRMDKPYILSEFGPPIYTQCPRDKNGLSFELSDKQKAVYYREIINQMYELKGYNLGGFVHHLGETTQESMTWWNINYSFYKKYPYWIIYNLYTGKKPPNLPPLIEYMNLSRSKLKKGEFFEINFRVANPEGDPLHYEYKISTTQEGVLKYYVNEFLHTKVKEENGIVKIQAPLKKGVYRVYLFVYDDKGNVASLNKSIVVE